MSLIWIVVSFLSLPNVQADIDWGSKLKDCSGFFSKPERVRNFERDARLIRILSVGSRFISRRSEPKILDGIPSHAESVVNIDSLFGQTLEVVPRRALTQALDWIDSQGEDFAEEFLNRALLALRDSFLALNLESPTHEEWSKEIDSIFNKKFDFYFDQDFESPTPKFRIPKEVLFKGVNLTQLNSEGWDLKFNAAFLKEKSALVQKTVDQNKFVVGRDLEAVQKHLGIKVADWISSIQVSGDWYDVGAGIAKLQRSYLDQYGPRAGMMFRATAPKFPESSDFQKSFDGNRKELEATPEIDALKLDLKKYREYFVYESGEYFEKRRDLPTGTAALVTDIVGAIAYSPDFRSVWLAEAGLLKPKGFLISDRTSARIYLPSGKFIQWPEFVSRFGTGMRKKFDWSFRRKNGVVFERTDEPLWLPKLELVYNSGWELPPGYLYLCPDCKD